MKLKFLENQAVCFTILFMLIMVFGGLYVPDYWDRIAGLLGKLKVPFLLGAFILTLFHFMLEPLRWRIYLHGSRDAGTVEYGKLLSLFSVTALVTYVFPAKLGLPVRMYLLKTQMNLGLAFVATLMAMDGLLSYVIWGIPAVIYFLSDGRAVFHKGLVVYLVAAACLGILLFIWRRKAGKAFDLLRKSVGSVGKTRLVLCAMIFVVDIVGFVLRHGLILYAAEAKINLIKLGFITTVSIFAGFLSMIPMGMGAYDASLIFLLSQSGIPHEVSLMVPVVNRAGNILASLVLGIPSSYAMGISFLSLKKKANDMKETVGGEK
jgi:uncharacterized membrane protein YbhN (UPF0104 family)